MFKPYNPSPQEKEELVKRIEQASQIYKQNLIGKTFLILFEGKSIEVIFKADNFLHMCGVETRLYAKDFLKKASQGKLKSYDIGFSIYHPYYFANIKTMKLQDALTILKRDSLIITDVLTQTRSYKLGTTDLEVVICFDSQFDDNGNLLNNILIPYSLRVEEIANSKFNDIYEVDFVLSKETGTKEYNCIEFGDATNLAQYISNNKLNNYLINIGGNEGGDEGDGNISTSVNLDNSFDDRIDNTSNNEDLSYTENNNPSLNSSQPLLTENRASNQAPIQSIINCCQETAIQETDEDYEIDM